MRKISEKIKGNAFKSWQAYCQEIFSVRVKGADHLIRSFRRSTSSKGRIKTLFFFISKPEKVKKKTRAPSTYPLKAARAIIRATGLGAHVTTALSRRARYTHAAAASLSRKATTGS